MKWFKQKPLAKMVGKKRITKKYLYFPKTFGRDTRWLEYANILEIVEEHGSGHYFWVEKDFVDNRTDALERLEKKTKHAVTDGHEAILPTKSVHVARLPSSAPNNEYMPCERYDDMKESFMVFLENAILIDMKMIPVSEVFDNLDRNVDKFVAAVIKKREQENKK